MHHPFRCLVAGPSQSGKSTFVCNLLLWQNDIIDICFDYVMIILGTEANKNEILSSLKDELRPGVMEIIELKKLYETTELMKKNFSSEFENFVKNKANRKKKGCVIFDDLMSELSECGLLLDLFSKYSSHYDLTTIHITQNIFYPCHTDMIMYSLSAHEHSIPHFLEKLKKTIKICEHWGLYKYLTHEMCKRHDGWTHLLWILMIGRKTKK